MTSGHTVTVDVNGAGLGTVFVDGVEVKGVQAVSATVTANEAPIVKLRLALRESVQLRYEGARISIDDVVMPVEVERALWRYLSEKYGHEIDVTTLSSAAREWALRSR